FDRKTLYVRLEPSEGRAPELAAARLELDVRIGDRRLALSSTAAGVVLDGASAHGRTVEVGTPFSTLGARAGDTLFLTLRLYDGTAPLGRYPADGAIA